MQLRHQFGTATSIPPAQSILDALTMAVALSDQEGTIVAANRGWCDFARDNGSIQREDFIGCNYLDVCDRASGVEGESARRAAAGIRAVLAGQAEFSLEYPCHSPAQQRWFQLRVSRLEHEGAPFAVVAHHDITQRVVVDQERQALLAKAQRMAERQDLLIRELHHRVKNSLSTIQGLLGATARSSTSVREFQRSFAARLAGLGRTHTLLTDDYWQTASVREMLRGELDRYEDGSGTRIGLAGPPFELSADLAIPFGMAIHELTINAATYGSLSTPRGCVEVIWDIVQEHGRRKLHLEWTERGGPPVEVPRRKGFGLTLLERVLTIQCSAEVDVAFEPEGLRVRLRAPLVEQRLVPSY